MNRSTRLSSALCLIAGLALLSACGGGGGGNGGGGIVTPPGGGGGGGGGGSTQPPPATVTSFLPASAPPGATVTINGSNFSGTRDNNVVTLNGVRATVTRVIISGVGTVTSSTLPNALEVTVPEGTGSGPVVVTVSGRNPVTAPGQFTFLPLPAISSINPTAAKPGAGLTISGSNFGTSIADISVTVNGTPALIDSAASTPESLQVTVPLGSGTGPVSVSVLGSTAAESDDFEYLDLEVGDVVTYAGNGEAAPVDGPAALASFYEPGGMAMDSKGNVFVADGLNSSIRKIAPDGTVSTFAGSNTGVAGFANGSGATARFNNPYDVAIDGNDNLYVADLGNHRIRMITPTGVVSTLAGSGTPGLVNGPGIAAQFNEPRGVAVDANGVVYVADTENYSIRAIAADTLHTVTTIAGNGTQGYEEVDEDGNFLPLADVQFWSPFDVAVDSAGWLYVAEAAASTIRAIVPGDTGDNPNIPDEPYVFTLAGTGEIGSTDGTTDEAQFNYPSGLIMDELSNGFTLYVADFGNHNIRVIDYDFAAQDWVVSTLAGNGAGFADGPRADAQFNGPWNVAIDLPGNLFVADVENQRIRTIMGAAEIVTPTPNNDAAGIAADRPSLATQQRAAPAHAGNSTRTLRMMEQRSRLVAPLRQSGGKANLQKK
ncbi:MAG: IPT/TIG domain-containing protein [Nevskiaceae bacterium]|jgi:sugar lactone lactonase YvrE|nr:IPT/TIG domain-containing protein [Nevskiaceae bacterium]